MVFLTEFPTVIQALLSSYSGIFTFSFLCCKVIVDVILIHCENPPLTTDTLICLGWREWVALPELGITRIKAKLDSGARTSALHAFEITPFEQNNVRKVRFHLQPNPRKIDIIQTCEALIVDQREVTDSGGHRELRWVIQTPIVIGNHSYPIDITLTSRASMRFRMLLGRTAFSGRYLIDVSRSYIAGKPPLAL
ncbi:MAG: ATP-dependent zinc protease [Gammaproteobacteria bacterium]|nr:ATP-dependent zinc protease [Gammaproteobacteria bacterium]